MKISNFKIMLLLVLGAFILTLPSNVCASNELTDQGMLEFVNSGLRAGKLNFANEVEISEHNAEYKEMVNERKKLEDAWEDVKDQIQNGVGHSTLWGDLGFSEAAGLTFDRLVTILSDPNEMDEKKQKECTAGLREIYKELITRAEGKKKNWEDCVKKAREMQSQSIQIASPTTGMTAAQSLEMTCSAMAWFKDDTVDRYKKRLGRLDEFDTLVDKIAPLNRKLAVSGEIDDQTYIHIDEKGRKTMFKIVDGTLQTTHGVTIGCVPIPAKIAEYKSCIFCPLFKTIFNASQAVSTNAFKVLGKSMAQIMLIGFSLFVAFSVLKLVGSFTKQDGPKFITGLLGQTFKVLFAYILLMKSAEVYTYIIAPVLSAGLEFGISLLFESGNKYLNACKSFNSGAMEGIIPLYLYNKLDCFVKAIQEEVSVPQTIGSSLMCVARNAAAGEMLGMKILWDFGMMFQGLIIFCFAWLISLAFAFYLIDATVRLGIVGALMPFLIACWPFKITSSYTSKGWEMFMNSFFTFVMLGLVISINIQLMGKALTGGTGGFEDIRNALNGDDIQSLKKLLDIGFSGFLILIACCLFGFKLTGQATELASTMAGGGGSNIGASLGGLAASGAKAAAGAAVSTGKGAAKTLGHVTGATAGLNKMKDGAINGMARGASKLFGAGKNSGAAGGENTKKQTPSAGPADAISGSAVGMQAQKAQSAEARNNGNGDEKKKIDGGSSTSAHSGGNANSGGNAPAGGGQTQANTPAGGNAPAGGGQTQANTPAGGNAPIPKTEDFVKAEQMLGSVAAKGGDTRAQKHQENLIERDRQSNIAIQARGDAMKQHSESEAAANQANSLRSQSEHVPAEQKKDLLNQAGAKDKEANELNAKAAENESRARAAEKVQERLGRELNETLKQTAELCAKNRVEEKLK